MKGCDVKRAEGARESKNPRGGRRRAQFVESHFAKLGSLAIRVKRCLAGRVQFGKLLAEVGESATRQALMKSGTGPSM